MARARKANKEPVTVVFSWSVKAGKEADFQQWMHTVHREASKWLSNCAQI
jgi:antibiotic biosynthesis monooxygenase (ABM) superfamily enzyme